MELDRRRFIAGATTAFGTLSLSGCVADDAIDAADGGDGNSSAGADDSGSVELTDMTYETVDQEVIGTFEFTNSAGQEAEFELGTAVQFGTDGVYGTHRNQTTVTVSAEETTTVEPVLVDGTQLSRVARNEFNNGYIDIVATMDGEEAHRESRGDQPSRHISFRVLYDGQWQGAIGGDSGTRSVQGSGDDHLPVDNGATIISGNAQKNDQSSQRLTVQIIVDGAVVTEQATTAGFGVAQVSAQASESPLSNPREPYEPPEVTITASAPGSPDTDDGEWSTGDTDTVPGKQAAESTAENYYRALVAADHRAVTQLLHPDSPMEPLAEEELADYERFDLEIESMRVDPLDRERGIARVGSEIVLIEREGSSRERFQSILELRVYDGEWRVWRPVEA